MNSVRVFALLCCAVLAATAPAAAQQTLWCEAVPPPQLPFLNATVAGGGGEGTAAAQTLHLKAELMEIRQNRRISLRGNAVLQQGATALRADTIDYRRAERRITVEGALQLLTAGGDTVYGHGADLELRDAGIHGFINDVDYRAVPRDGGAAARAAAARLGLEEGDRVVLEDARYTWCPAGNDDVVLRASTLTLDRATGFGSARHATLRFKNIPVLYLPYLGFPISDRRKSGFLLPAVGYDNNSGLVIRTPYYLNVAPALDMTLRPALHSRRGPQLGVELRHLNGRGSGGGRGVLDVTVLPGDKRYGNRDRWGAELRHEQQFSPRLRGVVDWRKVSDNAYLDDFESAPERSGLAWLPASAQLVYQSPSWHVEAGAAAWNEAGGANSNFQPYDRKPYFRLYSQIPLSHSGKPRYGFDFSVARFSHDQEVGGRRLVAQPSVALKAQRPWGQLGSQLILHHRRYDNFDDGRSELTRTVPMFSADGRLLFTRHNSAADTIHTLEPRLFYAHIPSREQEALLPFDSSIEEIAIDDYGKLFKENLFFGNDRTEDANRISAGLVTRTIDANSGVQRLHAALGRVFHLGSGPNHNDVTVAAVTASFARHWNTRLFLGWDHADDLVRHRRLRLDYAPAAATANSTRFTLGYHYDRNEGMEQLRLQARHTLGPRWSLRLDEWYSTAHRRNERTDFELEYNGCCWTATLGVRSRRTATAATTAATTTAHNAVFLRFGLRNAP